MTLTAVRVFSLILLIGSINAVCASDDDTLIKEHPYTVYVRSGTVSVTGTIISDRHILTLANVVRSMENLYSVQVHSGTSRLDQNGTVHNVKSIAIHPKFDKPDCCYDPQRIFYNIGVITLSDPITFDEYRQKVKLPSHDVQKDQVGYLLGFTFYHNELQVRQVAVLTARKCNLILRTEIDPKEMCSMGVQHRLCPTEPGIRTGQLVSNGEIVGLVGNRNIESCAVAVPEIHANVFAHKEFIESVMAKDA